MRRVLVVIALLTFASPLMAQAPSEWFGTWKLNIAKSTYNPGPPPYRRAQYTIAPSGDGFIVVYDMVYPRGGVSHMEWTGKIDGRDYPLQGIEEFVTYAYQKAADGSYEVVLKVDGRPTARSRITLSSDRKSMTTETTGTNARGQTVTTVTVYDRAN